MAEFVGAANVPMQSAKELAAGGWTGDLSPSEATVLLERLLRETAFDTSYRLPTAHALWPTRSGRVLSLIDLSADDPVADEVVLAAEQAGISLKVLRQRVTDAGADQLAFEAVKNRPSDTGCSGDDPIPDLPGAGGAVPRWRSAESQVAHVLRHEGWTVVDVSRTNVGWDLDATRADGRKRIEVKLLETRGARFALTNNELVAAKEHGSNYEIWVVLRSEKQFEFTVLSDPSSRLEFERVCRQWENQATVPDVGWRTVSFA